MTQRRLQEEVQSVEREATAERKAQADARIKTREAEAKAAADAAAAIIKAEQDVVDALERRSRDALDARTKEILALEDFYNEQLDKAGENAELIAQIEQQREDELARMRERFRAEDAAKEAEAQKAREEAERAAREARTEEERKAAEIRLQQIEEENRLAFEKQQAYESAVTELKTAAVSSTFSVLRNLTSAFEKDTEEGQKKAFKRNQALNIAETLISTYAAAQKAYASQLAIPSPDAPVRAQIAAGIAVAAGLAKVAAIKSQQFSGGGSAGGAGGAGGGGGGGIGGGTQSVGVDVGSLIPNQDTPTPEPVRAYVVENEISNKQALNRELQIQTTL
jgi:hypothetical protein